MQKREIATSVILSIVTCGIYGIYWFIKLTDDVKYAADDRNLASGGTAFLLTLVTCGIYGYYWAYKMGQTMSVAQQRYGLPAKDNSVLYLVLQIFGLGIVNYILIQSDLNTIIDRQQGTPNGAM